jgi:hypothetical protein
MITGAAFRRAEAVIERSGADKTIEQLLRPTSGRTGRPGQVSLRTYLAAWLVLAGNGTPMTAAGCHRLLTEQLARTLQRQLGIRAGGKVLSYRQVCYRLASIEALFIHTRVLAPHELDDADLAGRRELFEKLLDDLVAATRPRDLPGHGVIVTDGSAIEAAMRAKGRSPNDIDPYTGQIVTNDKPRRRKAARDAQANGSWHQPTAEDASSRASDPEARWGYRTATYDNKSSLFFGYELVAATRGLPVRKCDNPEPALIEGFRLIPANADQPAAALQLFDALNRREDMTTLHEVISDRGFSYASSDRWARPLLERGLRQVLDVHPADPRLVIDESTGVLMGNGWPMCPAMPDRLKRLDRPSNLSEGKLKVRPTAEDRVRFAQRKKALADFNAAQAEAETYAFRRVAGPDARGKERFECPARAGKIKCAGCPLSLLLPADVPEHEQPLAEPDAVDVCGKTVTLPFAVVGKLRQQHRWGSPNWISSYNRRAPVIEGSFGQLKGADSGRVKRGWTRFSGLVKTGLMLAFVVMSRNLALLRSFVARGNPVVDPLFGPLPQHHGFEEIDEFGQIAPHAPPA